MFRTIVTMGLVFAICQFSLSKDVTIYKYQVDKEIEVYRSATVEELDEQYSNNQTVLSEITKSGSSENTVFEKMQKLRDILSVAIERTNRYSQWKYDELKSDVIGYFDRTTKVVDEYLALMEANGAVNEALDKLKQESSEKAKIFKEKADMMLLPRYKNRYSQVSRTMQDQARHIEKIWNSIVKEREIINKGFILLNEAKVYYIDVKETFGGDYPLEDLVEVCNDIQALTRSTSRLQEIVTQTIQMKKVRSKASAPKPTVAPPKKAEQTKVDKAVEKTAEETSEAKAGPAGEDRTN